MRDKQTNAVGIKIPIVLHSGTIFVCYLFCFFFFFFLKILYVVVKLPLVLSHRAISTFHTKSLCSALCAPFVREKKKRDFEPRSFTTSERDGTHNDEQIFLLLKKGGGKE